MGFLSNAMAVAQVTQAVPATPVQSAPGTPGNPTYGPVAVSAPAPVNIAAQVVSPSVTWSLATPGQVAVNNVPAPYAPTPAGVAAYNANQSVAKPADSYPSRNPPKPADSYPTGNPPKPVDSYPSGNPPKPVDSYPSGGQSAYAGPSVTVDGINYKTSDPVAVSYISQNPNTVIKNKVNASVPGTVILPAKTIDVIGSVDAEITKPSISKISSARPGGIFGVMFDKISANGAVSVSGLDDYENAMASAEDRTIKPATLIAPINTNGATWIRVSPKTVDVGNVPAPYAPTPAGISAYRSSDAYKDAAIPAAVKLFQETTNETENLVANGAGGISRDVADSAVTAVSNANSLKETAISNFETKWAPLSIDGEFSGTEEEYVQYLTENDNLNNTLSMIDNSVADSVDALSTYNEQIAIVTPYIKDDGEIDVPAALAGGVTLTQLAQVGVDPSNAHWMILADQYRKEDGSIDVGALASDTERLGQLGGIAANAITGGEYKISTGRSGILMTPGERKNAIVERAVANGMNPGISGFALLTDPIYREASHEIADEEAAALTRAEGLFDVAPNFKMSEESGLVGVFGRGSEKISGWMDTTPVLNNRFVHGAVDNIFAPIQVAEHWEEKGAGSWGTVLPFAGTTFGTTGLYWKDLSNSQRALGIGSGLLIFGAPAIGKGVQSLAGTSIGTKVVAGATNAGSKIMDVPIVGTTLRSGGALIEGVNKTGHALVAGKYSPVNWTITKPMHAVAGTLEPRLAGLPGIGSIGETTGAWRSITTPNKVLGIQRTMQELPDAPQVRRNVANQVISQKGEGVSIRPRSIEIKPITKTPRITNVKQYPNTSIKPVGSRVTEVPISAMDDSAIGLMTPDELAFNKTGSSIKFNQFDDSFSNVTRERPTIETVNIPKNVETEGISQEGIPFVITRDMESQLGRLGYSTEQINKLTPKQAWDIIKGKSTNGSQTIRFKNESGAMSQEEMIYNRGVVSASPSNWDDVLNNIVGERPVTGSPVKPVTESPTIKVSRPIVENPSEGTQLAFDLRAGGEVKIQPLSAKPVAKGIVKIGKTGNLEIVKTPKRYNVTVSSNAGRARTILRNAEARLSKADMSSPNYGKLSSDVQLAKIASSEADDAFIKAMGNLESTDSLANYQRLAKWGDKNIKITRPDGTVEVVKAPDMRTAVDNIIKTRNANAKNTLAVEKQAINLSSATRNVNAAQTRLDGLKTSGASSRRINSATNSLNRAKNVLTIEQNAYNRLLNMTDSTGRTVGGLQKSLTELDQTYIDLANRMRPRVNWGGSPILTASTPVVGATGASIYKIVSAGRGNAPTLEKIVGNRPEEGNVVTGFGESGFGERGGFRFTNRNIGDGTEIFAGRGGGEGVQLPYGKTVVGELDPAFLKGQRIYGDSGLSSSELQGGIIRTSGETSFNMGRITGESGSGSSLIPEKWINSGGIRGSSRRGTSLAPSKPGISGTGSRYRISTYTKTVDPVLRTIPDVSTEPIGIRVPAKTPIEIPNPVRSPIEVPTPFISPVEIPNPSTMPNVIPGIGVVAEPKNETYPMNDMSLAVLPIAETIPEAVPAEDTIPDIFPDEYPFEDYVDIIPPDEPFKPFRPDEIIPPPEEPIIPGKVIIPPIFGGANIPGGGGGGSVGNDELLGRLLGTKSGLIVIMPTMSFDRNMMKSVLVGGNVDVSSAKEIVGKSRGYKMYKPTAGVTNVGKART